MKKAILILLALFGAVALMLAIAAGVFGLAGLLGKERVASRTILEVDLEQPFVEFVPDDGIAQAMMGQAFTVRDVVEALQQGAGDDNVAGLVARVGGGAHGMAVLQEIRDAILAFREQGKFAVAFAETFGEVGPGNGSYYLATAFDEIWLQPSGDIGLTGLIYESPFINRALGKLGLVPRMDHRHEFKNAMNMFTETSYTEAHRESMQRIMESQFGQMVRDIAAARGLDEGKVRAHFDHGPFLGEEAVDAGLVNGLAYRDEVWSRVKERAGRGAKLLFLHKYLERAGRPHDSGPTIALIYGVGAVRRGPSGYDPLFGDASMGSDSVTAAFRAAIEDKAVKAILFRVDSPGGSYVASDAIWRETLRAREAGKHVVVSMGNVAGSGGYFVAMDAHKIVAQPGTITASIGVLGGKMLTDGMWEWLGIDWDEVHSSAQSRTWSGTNDYSPAEWDRFQAWLDRVYEDFTGKVAAGRKMPIEKVREIAKGRIWSGEDGRKIGLVDELGGYTTALALAKEAAGIAPSDSVTLTVFPRRKEGWEEWLAKQMFEGGNDRESSEARAVAALLQRVQPVSRAARQAGIVPPAGGYGVLSMPPFVAAP